MMHFDNVPGLQNLIQRDIGLNMNETLALDLLFLVQVALQLVALLISLQSGERCHIA